MIVRNANALNPKEIACREDEILQEKMNAIFKHFLKLKIFSPSNTDNDDKFRHILISSYKKHNII